MNKEKVIEYLGKLEWEARQSDKFFIERNELHIENQKLHNKIDKAIEYIEEFPLIHYSSTEKIEGKRLSGKLVPVDELLEILKDNE